MQEVWREVIPRHNKHLLKLRLWKKRKAEKIQLADKSLVLNNKVSKRWIRMEKKGLLLLAFVFSGLVFISGCITGAYTFKDGFNELMELDARHNTSLYTENINASAWPVEDIDVIRQDYIVLRDKFNTSASVKKEDREALLLLMEFKINNIEATKYFKLKNAIGKRGTARDGFKCNDKPFILMAVSYFNMSHQHLLRARYAMDDMLTYYPQTRAVIDMENRRPVIMDPPFAEMFRFIEGETGIINKFCPEITEGKEAERENNAEEGKVAEESNGAEKGREGAIDSLLNSA